MSKLFFNPVEDKAIEDAANAAFGTVGWAYKDVPRMSLEIWETFLAILGEGNYKILAVSSGAGHYAPKEDGSPGWEGDEQWQRGQLLVSPEGMANAIAWAGPAGNV